MNAKGCKPALWGMLLCVLLISAFGLTFLIAPVSSDVVPLPSPSVTGVGVLNGPTLTETPTMTATPTPTPEITPIVYLEPSILYAQPYTLGSLDLMIANAEGFYGAWVRLTYGQQVSIVDIDSAHGIQIEPGDIFAGKSWYQLGNYVNPSDRTISYGAKMTFGQPADVTGGRLARIHLRPDELGLCPFEFVEVIFVDQRGVLLPAADRGGMVTVVHVLPPAATPTPTPGEIPPTPTPTPTVTATSFPTPVIYLDPGSVSLPVGEEADIHVRVDNVTDLYGVEFHIHYNPTILQVLDADGSLAGTQIVVGSFLSPDSVTQHEVDDGAGAIHIAYSQQAPAPPKSGGGIVARFRVRALASGATALAIQDTGLTNVSAEGMPHGAGGGFVVANARVITGYLYLQGRTNHAGIEIKHEDQVLGTTLSDGSFYFTSPVDAGQLLTLRASYPAYLEIVKTLLVPVDEIVDLGTATLFGGDVIGPHSIQARAPGCPGSPTVAVPGSPDERINLVDLSFVGGHFGKVAGDAGWEPSPDGCHPEWRAFCADVNGDLRCNIFDLVQVGNNYGSVGPLPW